MRGNVVFFTTMFHPKAVVVICYFVNTALRYKYSQRQKMATNKNVFQVYLVDENH